MGFGGIGSFTAGPDAYLRQIAAAKKCVSIPIIASLNVSTSERWVRFAELIEGAGADALELNVYFVPTDPTVSGLEVEARYTEIVSAVRSRIKIPLAVKLGPYFSSLPHLAGQMIGAGVNGLVLFNRYLQPEISLATYEVLPHLTLSTSDELRLPLRWVGILRDQVSISLAVTGGVHTGEDVVRSFLAGADVTMLASALLRHGPSLVPTLLTEVETWLASRGFDSIAAIRGLASFHRGKNASNYERANYADALAKFTQNDSRLPACPDRSPHRLPAGGTRST